MHDCSKQVLSQTKSYTSAYDLIGSTEIRNDSCSNKHSLKCDSQIRNDNEKKPVSDGSGMPNISAYITSEKYHKLNEKFSDKLANPSTSTIFYDLDLLIKSHSYHCVRDIEILEGNDKLNNNDEVKNFKSEAIVQECATQIKPNMLSVKKVKENKKKNHETSQDPFLTSDILLNDNNRPYTSNKSPVEDQLINGRNQKFWSFAKYQTEHMNPVNDEKKLKKKDRGKRTENPCPCQLFSYSCQCTHTKSLTQLAKNGKSSPVAEEVTSSAYVSINDKCNKHRNKKYKEVLTHENKRTSTINIIKQSKEVLCNHQKNINGNTHRKKTEVIANTMKMKVRKRIRQILCPNCKEMIDITSIIEEEESFNSKRSPLYRDNELSPPTPEYTHHTYQDSNDTSKVVESRDICNHEPQCELVPVCQILPTDNMYVNHNVTNKTAPLKPTPRVIRVTKGCRHHPPCTVVPSCQKNNVLNNNCEYIPPCLHRPRCVNLPLCAPVSKSIYYDEAIGKPEQDLGNTECLHTYHARCMANHQNESIENQINRVPNTCVYLRECSSRLFPNSTLCCISPCQPLSHPICKSCKLEKSCQYDIFDFCNQDITPTNKSSSNEDVVFIRDVGCQFRNKNYYPKDYFIQYKASCDTFDVNLDTYCTDFYALRYEDKFTIPLSGEDRTVSTVTFSSTEIDTQYPGHGERRNRDSQKEGATGLILKTSKSPHTNMFPTANFYLSANDHFKKKLNCKNHPLTKALSMSKKRQYAFLLKYRSSFLRGKYRNIWRKRRRSRTSHQLNFNWNTKRQSLSI